MSKCLYTTSLRVIFTGKRADIRGVEWEELVPTAGDTAAPPSYMGPPPACAMWPRKSYLRRSMNHAPTVPVLESGRALSPGGGETSLSAGLLCNSTGVRGGFPRSSAMLSFGVAAPAGLVPCPPPASVSKTANSHCHEGNRPTVCTAHDGTAI